MGLSPETCQERSFCGDRASEAEKAETGDSRASRSHARIGDRPLAVELTGYEGRRWQSHWTVFCGHRLVGIDCPHRGPLIRHCYNPPHGLLHDLSLGSFVLDHALQYRVVHRKSFRIGEVYRSGQHPGPLIRHCYNPLHGLLHDLSLGSFVLDHALQYRVVHRKSFRIGEVYRSGQHPGPLIRHCYNPLHGLLHDLSLGSFVLDHALQYRIVHRQSFRTGEVQRSRQHRGSPTLADESDLFSLLRLEEERWTNMKMNLGGGCCCCRILSRRRWNGYWCVDAAGEGHRMKGTGTVESRSRCVSVVMWSREGGWPGDDNTAEMETLRGWLVGL